MAETLAGFYELMDGTVEVRRRMVVRYLDEGGADPADVRRLAEVLEALEGLPVNERGRSILLLGGDRDLAVDLGYEKAELRKDLLFFEGGEREFAAHVESAHPGFGDLVERGVDFLAGGRYRTFVTDRDGTVNNYCGRYRSSVQSAYNAIFLTRFVRSRADNAVIVTAAPLRDPGIETVSVMPPGTLVYAASKAREFVDREGVRRTFPIDPRGQALLTRINDRLVALLKRPGRGKFALIGSGLQFKFGETTIARQDITGAVAEEESAVFEKEVKGEVLAVDPSMANFHIVDTGLDIEIVLGRGGSHEGAKEAFGKGDGLSFLDGELGLDLARGPNLVCGDTGSDLGLVEACMRESGDTRAVFVTRDEALIRKVESTGAKLFVVPAPDILVCMLDRSSRVS